MGTRQHTTELRDTGRIWRATVDKQNCELEDKTSELCTVLLDYRPGYALREVSRVTMMQNGSREQYDVLQDVRD